MQVVRQCSACASRTHLLNQSDISLLRADRSILSRGAACINFRRYVMHTGQSLCLCKWGKLHKYMLSSIASSQILNIIMNIFQRFGKSPVQEQPKSPGMERLHPDKTSEQWASWLPFHTGLSVFSVEDGKIESKQQPNGSPLSPVLGRKPVSHLPDQRSSLAGHRQFQHFPLTDHLRLHRRPFGLLKGTLGFCHTWSQICSEIVASIHACWEKYLRNICSEFPDRLFMHASLSREDI